MTNRAELDAIIAATCPRCATDRRDCTCPGGLRSRSLAEVFATATGLRMPPALKEGETYRWVCGCKAPRIVGDQCVGCRCRVSMMPPSDPSITITRRGGFAAPITISADELIAAPPRPTRGRP